MVDHVVPAWTPEHVDMSDLRLPMIIVTEGTSDYPGVVVARLWDALTGPTNYIKKYRTLAEVGPSLEGWAKLSPQKHDDPVIKEIYL